MKTISLIGIFFAFFLTTSAKLFAQQDNIWIFGNHAGIDFNSGSATPFYNPVIDIYEGSAVACDAGGNLLFYSDGDKIWDRNNQLMPNGSGLGGGSSSTSVLIVQKPGACSKYFVFTTEDHNENGDMYYSEIDMCLNSGLGDVVAGSKKVFMHTNVSEKLCVVRHTNGSDAWLITHSLSSSNYLVFSITSSGVNTSSTSYNVGSYLASNMQSGYLKASPSGTKLAFGILWSNVCEAVNFDPSTGGISGPATNFGSAMTTSSNGLFYGLEFSPGGQFLYVTRTGFSGYSAYLYQVDLVTGLPVLISSAATSTYYYGALRLAPDGKIYMAKYAESNLGVINEPDNAGLTCNYVDAGLSLASNSSSNIGLPLEMVTMPSGSITVSLGNDTSVCDQFTINLSADCGTSFLWQDQTTDTSYTVINAGTYWVTGTNSCGSASDTIEVFSLLQSSINGDTIICKGQSVVLSAPPASTYLWNTGAVSQSISDTPAQTTDYWVIVTAGNCTDTAYITVEVAFPPKISFNLLTDTICINSSPILLTGGIPGGGFYYGTGVSNNYFYPATAGTGPHTIYYVYSDPNGCSDTAYQEIVVEDCTGTGEFFSLHNVRVSPTITNDKLTIYFENSLSTVREIQVVDGLGKVFFKESNLSAGANDLTISLSRFPSGLYYIVVKGSNVIVAKVVKQ